MDIPGYNLSKHFEIEIDVSDADNMEKIIFATDSFPLPELGSNTFQVVWGPGHPAASYAGSPTVSPEITVEMTNFYEEELVGFLVGWYEDCIEDCVANMRNGFIIGYDDDKNVVYKAKLLDVWLSRFISGPKAKDVSRQRLSVTLTIRDVEHIFE